MSVKTEINQEKEIFNSLIDNVKKSEKILVHKAPHVRRTKSGTFCERIEIQLDNISLEMFFDSYGYGKDKQLYTYRGKYMLHGTNKGIVHLIVKDQDNKIVFDENCEMPESAKEENAKLKTARFKLGQKLFDVTVNRLEKTFMRSADPEPKKTRVMSDYTDIQQEKDLFGELTSEIKNAKKLVITNLPGTKYLQRQAFKFDNFTVRVSFLKENCFIEYANNGRVRMNDDALNRPHEIVDFSVIDETGNLIIARNCMKPTNETGELRKAQQVRFDIGKELYELLLERTESSQKQKDIAELKKGTALVAHTNAVNFKQRLKTKGMADTQHNL